MDSNDDLELDSNCGADLRPLSDSETETESEKSKVPNPKG
jgi:hypothetical protein